MKTKKNMRTKARTGTSTLIAAALLAGAGLAAAAGLATESMHAPQLLVRLTPSQPPSAEAVAGSEDVTLLSFDMQARGGTATVDAMTFSVFGDTDASFSTIEDDAPAEDRFMECRLEATDGTVLAGPSPVTAGSLTFSDSLAVSSTSASTYLIRCDLSAAAALDGDADRFAASIAGESSVTASIGGTALSGTALMIGLTDTLNAAGAISMRVQTSGTLSLRVAADTTESAILLGSTSKNEIGTWEFQASGEDFFLETLSFDDLGSATGAATASIACAKEDGTTYSDTESVSAGKVVFQNAECYAPASAKGSIKLTVDINPIGSSGLASGDTLKFVLNATDAGTFSAVGAVSGNTLTESDLAATVSGRKMVLRKTKPTVSLASGSPSGAGVPGISEILRFNVAAASQGFVTFEKIIFNVTTSDADHDFNLCSNLADATKWEFYNLDDSSSALDDAADWTFLDSGVGDPIQDCDAGNAIAYAVLDLQGSATTGTEEIAAGETKTYAVKVNTTGAGALDDDMIRLDIINELKADTDTAFDGTADNDGEAIRWDDDTEGSDATGDLVKNLPVTGGSIQYYPARGPSRTYDPRTLVVRRPGTRHRGPARPRKEPPGKSRPCRGGKSRSLRHGPDGKGAARGARQD